MTAQPTKRRELGSTLVLGGALLGALLGLALAAPWLSPYQPAQMDPPGPYLMLGPDRLARDVATRLLYGLRSTLACTATVVAAVTLLGAAVGTVAGYWGGWVDAVGMAAVDLVLSFPTLVLAVFLLGAVGPGLPQVALVLAVAWWAPVARMARGLAWVERHSAYIEAARALGGSDLHILLRHMVPALTGPLAVVATLEAASVVGAIGGLGFLGLGAQPPEPELGAMLQDGRQFLETEPQLVAYPAAMLVCLVLGLYLLGDGLRDLDERRRGLR